MASDDRKWHNLRSNTNARTRYEPSRLQKDPPRTSSVSSYTAAQYAGTTNSPRYVAPVNSRQYSGPVNPAPYAGSGYVRPPQYTRPRYSVQNDRSEETADEMLASLFDQFSIDLRPSTGDHRPAPVSTPPPQDAINEVVEEVLSRDLKKLGNEKLLPTNPIFDLARQFAQRWDISDKAVNSHIRLACGYFKFPVILLLNPAPKHEILPFDQMVDKCKTLRWIEDVLYSIGLGLGDVIILDACTLLGSDRIKEIGRKGERIKAQAMAEAYDVTQEMLRKIQPNIILSCQCSTSFPNWNARGHIIAQQLCSSIRGAKDREVKEVYLNERTVNVIQAYHPGGFLNRKDHHDTSGQLLKGIFRTVYEPCANWKSHHLLNTVASSNTKKNVRTSANNPIAKETEGFYTSVVERKPTKDRTLRRH